MYTPELGCMFRYNKEARCLEYAAEFEEGGFDDWALVEEYAVGDEIVTFQSKRMTLSEAYRIIERKLGVIPVKQLGIAKVIRVRTKSNGSLR